ncbi:hypothetical protein DFJ73DRAFT_767672 [Zopfochytrium polystomum]|nr:hypothetical protein DFJ73DRAFT_767672 [Zopfochytrium polystomum]
MAVVAAATATAAAAAAGAFAPWPLLNSAMTPVILCEFFMCFAVLLPLPPGPPSTSLPLAVGADDGASGPHPPADAAAAAKGARMAGFDDGQPRTTAQTPVLLLVLVVVPATLQSGDGELELHEPQAAQSSRRGGVCRIVACGEGARASRAAGGPEQSPWWCLRQQQLRGLVGSNAVQCASRGVLKRGAAPSAPDETTAASPPPEPPATYTSVPTPGPALCVFVQRFQLPQKQAPIGPPRPPNSVSLAVAKPAVLPVRLADPSRPERACAGPYRGLFNGPLSRPDGCRRRHLDSAWKPATPILLREQLLRR